MKRIESFIEKLILIFVALNLVYSQQIPITVYNEDQYLIVTHLEPGEDEFARIRFQQRLDQNLDFLETSTTVCFLTGSDFTLTETENDAFGIQFLCPVEKWNKNTDLFAILYSSKSKSLDPLTWSGNGTSYIGKDHPDLVELKSSHFPDATFGFATETEFNESRLPPKNGDLSYYLWYSNYGGMFAQNNLRNDIIFDASFNTNNVSNNDLPEEQPSDETDDETNQEPTEEEPTEEEPTEEEPTEEEPNEEQQTEEQPTEEQPTEEQPTEEQQNGGSLINLDLNLGGNEENSSENQNNSAINLNLNLGILKLGLGLGKKP